MKHIPYFILIISTIASCRNGQDGIKPAIKPLMEAVYASGYVVAKDEYQVFSQAEGYLAEKLVSDGQDVKKGDPLFIIAADQQSARYRLARENFEMATSNYGDDSPVLAELQTAIDAARTKMQFDSLNYMRYKNLWDQKATTRSEFDRMKLLYDNSRNDYVLQQKRLAKMKDQLYIEMQNTESALRIARDETGRYTIRSEINGKVFSTMKEKGELVRRNEAVAVIGKDSQFYLQLNVDELDVQRVTVGQEVLTKIDAYPDKIFHAKVSKVFPMINKQQQSIRVDADLTEDLPGGFSGLALEANIVVRKKDNALVIPKAALLPGDSVNIKTPDGIQKIKIEKGIETLDEIEVLDGLDSTDVIEYANAN
jgi:multidrug efflux pump subunit AcrA (membrane-fusion protein)